MADVFIRHINESWCAIETEYGILQELSDKYIFFAAGYKFHPMFKAGRWDGKIRLLQRDGKLPKGLVPSMIDTCHDLGYEVEISEEFERFAEKIQYNIDSLDLPFDPYDYQVKALEYALKKKRVTLLSATGSGKSMIIYLIVRALMEGRRILIVVPTVMLVTQLFEDFKSYGFDAEQYVHTISQGAKKISKKPITITTWQSIYTIKEADWWNQWDVLIGDEVHTFKAQSLGTIMNNSTEAFYRIGLTGTLDDTKVNQLSIVGHFGPIHRVSSTADLIERGILSKIDITCLVLKWPPAITKTLKGLPYKDEVDVIIANKDRNMLIAQMCRELDNNTLVLFRFVHKQGKALYELIKQVCDNKKVYLVYGGVDADDREKIRQLAERHDDCVIVASYGTMSTGVNIKNIHNGIFASPYKAKITVLQSIGRGLRLNKNKQSFRLFDLADDMRPTEKAKPNYALSHFMERYKFYKQEQLSVDVVEKEL